jgi:6-phosphofructokinase 2
MREFSELLGKEINDESELEAEARKIIAEGQSEVIVISLGAGGILAVWEGGCERIQSPTVTIKSKVGAGDSMVAGIVLSLARGKQIEDALRFGVAAGAAAVMTPGTELCRLEDTERLYRQIKGK